jgi:hypothetical protein
MTDPTDTITQEQVNALLKRLRQLHQRIHATRQELAPMENNLAHVYKEYQAAIGHLQRKSYQLQTKIVILQELLDSSSNKSSENEGTVPSEEPRETIDLTGVQIQQPHDDKDVAKDMLHEHIFMVLDNKDDELLAHLQAMCSNPATKLIDVLEQIPWGSVWTSPTTPVETLSEQYQRLATWEQALQTHLRMLEQARERSQSDRRYGLWLQYQKGQEAWNRFLQESALRMQDLNDELNLELQRLRDRQAEMGDEHE